MKDVVGFIAEQMAELGVPYAFITWNQDIQYPYWVGDYMVTVGGTEDGFTECTFTLTGTTRGTWLELMTQASSIKDAFFFGVNRTIREGKGLLAFYAGERVIPTNTEEFKRLEIDLIIRTWGF